MKTQNTAAVLPALAPAALFAPPVLLIGALVGIGLVWLLSGTRKTGNGAPDPDTAAPHPKAPKAPKAPAEARLEPSGATRTGSRITREDLAEALAYGERPVTRKECAAALEALGYRKSAVYNALAPQSRFLHLIETAPDGLIEWKG